MFLTSCCLPKFEIGGQSKSLFLIKSCSVSVFFLECDASIAFRGLRQLSFVSIAN